MPLTEVLKWKQEWHWQVSKSLQVSQVSSAELTKERYIDELNKRKAEV